MRRTTSSIWLILAGLWVSYAGCSKLDSPNDITPSGVNTGGTFSVDRTGATLPLGVTLASNGILSVSASAGVGQVVGVVFSYLEP